MASAYTPGLQLSKRTTVKKIRELPLPGKTLISVGDKVDATTAVLSAELPGDLTVVRVADRMGFDPEEILSDMKVAVGDSVARGDLLCHRRTLFGLFSNELHCPGDGVVEFFTETNAHLGIRHASVPITVSAYISGEVVDCDEGKSVTIESDASFLQGIFGVGGERLGKILCIPVAHNKLVEPEDLDKLPASKLKDSLLIGGGSFSSNALDFAKRENVAGVVTGSIDATTLKNFVGFDIGVSITGDEDVPFTLFVTEGFGFLPISERFYKLAKSLEGKTASINGATQVRAGAMRPELIVPIEPSEFQDIQTEKENYQLNVGSKIRIIRVPYFGQLGTVSELTKQPETIPSGAKVRVLKAKLDSGEIVSIPRANIELVF